MGPVIITTAILVVCFLVNADFVGKTCSQHHWNIVVSIYFWFCLQSKVSRKGRWSLPRMFFVAFVQFVSKLFFPKMYWDFNGWACNPAGGPQDPQGCNYCNYPLVSIITWWWVLCSCRNFLLRQKSPCFDRKSPSGNSCCLTYPLFKIFSHTYIHTYIVIHSIFWSIGCQAPGVRSSSSTELDGSLTPTIHTQSWLIT